MMRCEDYYSLSKNRTLFIQKFLHLLPELAALAFENLVISDDFHSMFGKYFWSQRNHKTCEKFLRKNSWISSLSSRNFHALVDPTRLQCYQSNQLRTLYVSWALNDIFVCFILIKTNNNIRQLSPLWQPWTNLAKMCRFFAFSRIFLLIYEAWYFFAQNSISVTWKHYPMREFDWMVTLTVAFFDGVSRRLSVFMRS